MPTIEYFRQLAADASSLKERMEGAVRPVEGANDHALAAVRLDAWRRIVALDDPERFACRLRWDGLDHASAMRALGVVALAADQPLPPWCATVAEVIEQVAALAPSYQRIQLPPHPEPIPFIPILMPMLAVARTHLRRQLGESRHTEVASFLTPEAWSQLELGLLDRLLLAGCRTLYHKFTTFRAARSTSAGCYDAFMATLFSDGLVEFLREYAVLAKLWALAIEQWAAAMADFLTALLADGPQLASKFGLSQPLRVVAVEPLLSDPHHGGRGVIRVGFANGRGLFYKPRALGPEAAVGRVIEWGNARSPGLPLRGPVILDRPGHGWAEQIIQQACQDLSAVRRYYNRAGMLLCLASLLRTTDLHSDNVIAAAEHPVLIDLETVLHPLAHRFDVGAARSQAERAAHQRLQCSVLATHLLWRYRQVAGADTCYDESGLGGTGDPGISLPQRDWRAVNTDAMERVSIQVPLPVRNNRVLLDGNTAHPRDHLDVLLEGFAAMYRCIMGCRNELSSSEGPLASLREQEVRFVFRNTSVYTELQQHALEPELLREGIDRSLMFEVLGRTYLAAKTRPPIWPLFAAERQALEQLDVPRFGVSAGSVDLKVDGDIVQGYFEVASFDLARDRIMATTEENLAFERLFIRTVLSSPSDPEPPPAPAPGILRAPGPLDAERLIDAAGRIATRLAEEAIWGSDGSATWLGWRSRPELRCYQCEPIGLALGDGSAGVLLFLAALDRAGGAADSHRSLRDGVLQHVRRQFGDTRKASQLARVGGMVGRASVAYALTRCGLLMDDPKVVAEALAIAAAIDPAQIAADRQYDVLGGAAGTILALLPLLEATSDARVFNLVIACGDHLLASRSTSPSGHRSWPTLGQRFLTGFAHGAAGIAAALARLSARTASAAFLAAAQEAIAYEDSLFAPEVDNWPDLRTNAEEPYCCSWCHGAPGIALARLSALSALDTPLVRRDIDRALETTRKSEYAAIDYVCCGGFGRADVLLEGGRVLGRPELFGEALSLAERLLSHAESRGGFKLLSGPLALRPNPGLFQGLAGIGYTLIRLAAPSLIPSVLALA